jgi:hypothetical protein
MATLVLNTNTQAALFKYELAGQISDGHWENTRPTRHWEVWCDAEIKVGPNAGRDFFALKDNYNFTSKDLLDCVGGRMLVIARLTLKYGFTDDIDVLASLFDCTTGEWTGQSDWMKTYERYQAVFAKYDLDEVKAVGTDPTYDMRSLKKDLTAIKAACKNPLPIV